MGLGRAPHPSPWTNTTSCSPRPPQAAKQAPPSAVDHRNCLPWGLKSAPLCLPKIMPKLLAHRAWLTFCSHPGKGQEHRDPSVGTETPLQ